MTRRFQDTLTKGATAGLLTVLLLGLPGLSAGCGKKDKAAKAAASKADKGDPAGKAALMEATPRKRAAAPRPHRGDAFVAKMKVLFDRACRCKDRDCAMKVLSTLSAMKKSFGNIRLRRGQNAQLQKSSVRFGRCLGRRGVKPDEILQALK